MPFVDPAGMVELFGATEMTQLSQLHHPEATKPNEALIQANINKAEDLISSYASAKYADYLKTLTTTTTPVVLQTKAADIARYFLDMLRPREDVRQRYEDALSWLKMLAAGTVTLPCDQAGNAPVQEIVSVGRAGQRDKLIADNIDGYC